jgi:HSP20 family molecular chaperone IbpA
MGGRERWLGNRGTESTKGDLACPQPTIQILIADTMQDEGEEDGGKIQRVLSHDPQVDKHDLPIFILNERKVGPFQRTFTLPIDADMKGLKAKLEDGLLRIDLPKRDMSAEPRMKIEIE